MMNEAYKTFIGISTGLIPPKKGRGKGAQGTKAIVIPKKATSASKKKKQKKKVSIRDESSDEESEEQEERLVRLISAPVAQVKELVRPKVSDSDEGELTFLFDDKDEKIEDIPWKSTDDDEFEDDDEEDEPDDDKNIDIEKTDDERTDIDVEDQDDEELKADEEQKGDDQFINSPNASLIGTIPENAEAEINSLLDIQIQQDVLHIQQEPFHVVK
ncbi:hypothetical protein Tco_0903033, partial [Tanacetum coccineum]